MLEWKIRPGPLFLAAIVSSACEFQFFPVTLGPKYFDAQPAKGSSPGMASVEPEQVLLHALRQFQRIQRE